MQDKIKNITLIFFKKLNIEIESIKVEKNEEKNLFHINIKTEEFGVLIGTNGNNIEAIQNILKIFYSKQLNEKIKIQLKVNDYSKTRDERLYDFIDKEIEYLKKIGTEIKLPLYSAYERKKIHSYIIYKKDSSICSKSSGKGKDRRIFLYIKKNKTRKLTIDIDGNDI